MAAHLLQPCCPETLAELVWSEGHSEESSERGQDNDTVGFLNNLQKKQKKAITHRCYPLLLVHFSFMCYLNRQNRKDQQLKLLSIHHHKVNDDETFSSSGIISSYPFFGFFFSIINVEKNSS